MNKVETAEVTIIEERIFTIRGQQVMIDRDLAELYATETKVLNQAVKRNIDKFPADFRFQLTTEEKRELVTICDRFKTLKHSSINPYVFTEHGVLMLANVLKSETATHISIGLVKTFVRLRQVLSSNAELQLEIERIKNYIAYQSKKQENHDKNIDLIFEYIDRLQAKTELSTPPERKQIGYELGKKK